mgnify:CR=1 FL=1
MYEKDQARKNYVNTGERYQKLRKSIDNPFRLSVSNRGTGKLQENLKHWEDLVEFSEKPDMIVEVKL